MNELSRSGKKSLSKNGKLVATILACLLVVAGPVTAGLGVPHVAHGDSQSTSIKAALGWLSTKWQHDGSYGPYTEISTPAAAYALWLNDSGSVKAHASFAWLASQLDDHMNDIGEADILGEIIFVLHATGNTGLLRNAADYKGILSYQEPSTGGFKGYYSSDGPQVVSSVDTAFALLGLIGSNAINSTSTASATNYLLQLQNPDGSFNLTRTQSSLDSNDSLGLEPVSTTALVVLALKQASYQVSESHVSKALIFLNAAASTNYTSTMDHKGHVYAASLSVLAFKAYDRASDLSLAASFLRSQQNQTDGGFHDVARIYSKGSNALDTGWAAVALQQASQVQGPEQAPALPGSWLLVAIVGIIIGVSAGLLIIVYRLRKRPQVQAKIAENKPSSMKIARDFLAHLIHACKCSKMPYHFY
ncbi:MAG TPA: prenyltransferase/squalene oxidase repeat-containing protein [Candidatus Bathyarchaeia archaeon]|nr:prenyltransferase/squalene oxidase repeat-containing protein [Candidatus Bathyarchaeia archaeon]